MASDSTGMQRLVLGGGPIAQSFLRKLAEKPGELAVITSEQSIERRLNSSDIPVDVVEQIDDASLRSTAPSVDSIIAGGSDRTELRKLVSIARSTYPDAFIMGIGPMEGPCENDDLSEMLDAYMSNTRSIASSVLTRAGDDGLRLRRLIRILRSIDGPLAIVPHDNPDPDAIAAAVALSEIASKVGLSADVCYFGEINHQENRALVNLLNFELEQITQIDELDSYDGFALVDHSQAGVNDGLPPETPIDIVVDHHPPRAPVEARFVDLRSDVGSTSTILATYLQKLDIVPSEELATGLLYGIWTDTDDFTREVAEIDFTIAAALTEFANYSMLQRIETPSVTARTLQVMAKAIQSRRIEDSILTSCVGNIRDRDTLAQAADLLLDLESADIVLVYGYDHETVYLSARTRGTQIDLGGTLRDAFGQIGTAGGHADMAGAQIPVGMLVTPDEADDPRSVIEDTIVERFFEELGIEVDHAAMDVYANFFGTDFEYEE